VLIAINIAAVERQPVFETKMLGIQTGNLEPLFGANQGTVVEGKVTDLKIEGRSGLILKLR